MSTAAEKRHLERVASLGCIMVYLGFAPECSGRVEVHHLRHGQGMTDRASDFLTMPLCVAHHASQPFGVHYKRSFETRTRLTELDLLAKVNELLELLREPDHVSHVVRSREGL